MTEPHVAAAVAPNIQLDRRAAADARDRVALARRYRKSLVPPGVG